MSEYLLIHPVRKNPDSDFRYLCVACWWDSNSRFISCRWFSNNVLSSSIRALRWLASSDISSGESTTVMVVFSARVIALHIPLTILSELFIAAFSAFKDFSLASMAFIAIKKQGSEVARTVCKFSDNCV